MQVGENGHRHRVEVNLFGDGQVLLKREEVHRVRWPVEGGRVGDGGRVQPGVDQDPLLAGLDEVGRDGEADRLVERLASSHDPAAAVNPPTLSNSTRIFGDVMRQGVPAWFNDDCLHSVGGRGCPGSLLRRVVE